MMMILHKISSLRHRDSICERLPCSENEMEFDLRCRRCKIASIKKDDPIHPCVQFFMDLGCKFHIGVEHEMQSTQGSMVDKLQGVRESLTILTQHFFLAWLEISGSYLVCSKFGCVGLITCIEHRD